MAKAYWVYILASRTGRLYVGVTNDLRRRLYQHRTGRAGYTAQWRTVRLVHFERTPSVRAAIAREKELKGWRREKKVSLIESLNHGWVDLSRGWSDGDSVDRSGVNPSSRCSSG
jgi:putative endonuclease